MGWETTWGAWKNQGVKGWSIFSPSCKINCEHFSFCSFWGVGCHGDGSRWKELRYKGLSCYLWEVQSRQRAPSPPPGYWGEWWTPCDPDFYWGSGKAPSPRWLPRAQLPGVADLRPVSTEWYEMECVSVHFSLGWARDSLRRGGHLKAGGNWTGSDKREMGGSQRGQRENNPIYYQYSVRARLGKGLRNGKGRDAGGRRLR